MPTMIKTSENNRASRSRAGNIQRKPNVKNFPKLGPEIRDPKFKKTVLRFLDVPNPADYKMYELN